jgi:Flp pilus assembly protein CpaB
MSSLVFAGAAVACALAAVGVMHAYAQRLQAAHPTLGAPVAVQVATRALTRGTQLTPDMLRSHQIPSTFVPPAAVTNIDQLLGRTLAADVARGDVLTRTRLAGTTAGPVAALVPIGSRAFLVPSTLPPGVVAAGDLVDVLAAFGGARSHVETVASGVEVARILQPVSAGGIEGTADASGPSLVVLVDPDTARELAYAQAFAKLVVTVDPPGTSTLAPAASSP